MKKYLPWVIFVVVFASVLAGQIVFKKFFNHTTDGHSVSEYQAYENIYLHSKFKTLSGEELEMSKIKAPVVIYNFWASWCIPCLQEMPSMIELKKKYADDQMQIVSINTDEDDQRANIGKTMKKMNVQGEFLVVPDTAAQIVNQFKISAIPVTIIFRYGKVVHFSNGPMDFSSGEIIEKMNQWVKI